MSTFGVASPNPWVRVLDALEKKVNRTSYETWLKPTRYDHAQGPVLFVRVPTPEFCHIGERYGDLISEAFDNLGLEFRDVEFVTAEAQSGEAKVHAHSGAQIENAPTPDKPVSTPVMQQRFDWDGAAQLNPKYTFDDFVIGAGNQFAHAAAHAVAVRPSKAYNPLFLYGGVGMGKTHLMQAIGHEIKVRQPEKSICYVSGERFTNDMITALRNNRMSSFRDKYRNMDVLLVDDIHILGGKERMQEEFFHTFNELYDHQKQIVISSDSSPKNINGLVERLRSRFEWGLMVDVQPPDLETKMAILDKKAELEGVTLPEDVRIYIATKTKSNVRELEGALIKLIAYSSVTGSPITLGMAQQVLKYLIPSERRVTMEGVARAVAEEFQLQIGQLKQKSNARPIAYPRQIAMYLIKELTACSLPEIGRFFGGKHHTTVLHSIQKIDKSRQKDADLNRLIQRVTDSIH